jgi:hypothetical protein
VICTYRSKCVNEVTLDHWYEVTMNNINFSPPDVKFKFFAAWFEVAISAVNCNCSQVFVTIPYTFATLPCKDEKCMYIQRKKILFQEMA